MASRMPKDKDGFHSFVNDEIIWKEQVGKENTIVRIVWPENYGFLINEYDQLTRDLADGRVMPERIDQRKPADGAPKHRFPKTAATEIGWRSGDPKCQLEIYGRYFHHMARGKRDITKSLGWPELGID